MKKGVGVFIASLVVLLVLIFVSASLTGHSIFDWLFGRSEKAEVQINAPSVEEQINPVTDLAQRFVNYHVGQLMALSFMGKQNGLVGLSFNGVKGGNDLRTMAFFNSVFSKPSTSPDVFLNGVKGGVDVYE